MRKQHDFLLMFISSISGSMSNAVAIGNLPKSASSFAHIDILWIIILFCHKCIGQTIYRSFIRPASIHITSMFCVIEL